jgi:hypothetical protein
VRGHQSGTYPAGYRTRNPQANVMRVGLRTIWKDSVPARTSLYAAVVGIAYHAAQLCVQWFADCGPIHPCGAKQGSRLRQPATGAEAGAFGRDS